jgi:FlaA1/EpsC-like NDP-sugar epimerase
MNTKALRSYAPYIVPACHIVVLTVAFWGAWLLRFDFVIPDSEFPTFSKTLPVAVVAKMIVFLAMGLRTERWWRYKELADVLRLFRTNVIASAASGVLIMLLVGAEFPRSVYLLDLVLCFLLSGAAMFGVRIYHEISASLRRKDDSKGLLIYGAGIAGLSLAREIRENPSLGYRVIGFLDDNRSKKGLRVAGFTVLGSGDDARQIVENARRQGRLVEEIVVAMPSANCSQIREVVARGNASGVPCRVVPGLGELISGKLAISRMREIAVADILGRKQIELDLEPVRRTVQGRSVLVTGAAGSIGTELCHQVARLEPFLLIAFDHDESGLFRLENDLREKYPALNLVIEAGDIRSAPHVESVIERRAVNSIFHAAAYKQVPMMERQICEATRNNVIGTWNVAQAAWLGNVADFVLISTDEAVNPASVMGLGKRITELIVSTRRSAIGPGPHTKFVAVRLGNVLASNGSVVSTFLKQIAAGGPVTVTHPEMRRYFMTVHEAVQLVLQASSIGRNTEIFVLDMGKPVKILDLVHHMISLAGFVPGEDIEIRFTGLRPGEKLCEEVRFDAEDIVKSSHPKIRIFKGQQLPFEFMTAWIVELQHLLWKDNAAAVVEHMKKLVPEFRPETAVPAAEQIAAAPDGASRPNLIQAFEGGMGGMRTQ